ncbi:MAG: hypothetical protein CVU14_07615 [Bacteroidetes bacterium HGW-Bacteroidetes-9]|jgi:hypothetical protein|nr:MAG: hypothetical protein CVU14_07615 [Bacteroidetes bacterium HGW-Bacteroidetes-9]
MKKFHTFTSIIIILLISIVAAFAFGQEVDKTEVADKSMKTDKGETIILVKVLKQIDFDKN